MWHWREYFQGTEYLPRSVQISTQRSVCRIMGYPEGKRNPVHTLWKNYKINPMWHNFVDEMKLTLQLKVSNKHNSWHWKSFYSDKKKWTKTTIDDQNYKTARFCASPSRWPFGNPLLLDPNNMNLSFSVFSILGNYEKQFGNLTKFSVYIWQSVVVKDQIKLTPNMGHIVKLLFL